MSAGVLAIAVCIPNRDADKCGNSCVPACSSEESIFFGKIISDSTVIGKLSSYLTGDAEPDEPEMKETVLLSPDEEC